MKKNLLLSAVFVLFSWLCLAAGPFTAPDGCIKYDAQTNKLILKANYGFANWVGHVNGYDTWIYIRTSHSAANYIGPFASSSCDPVTYSCEYDISSLIGLIAVPGCYEFFAVSSHSHSSGVPLPPGVTPPVNPAFTDVFPTPSPAVWVSRPPGPEAWDICYDIGSNEQYGHDACTCPDNTDTLAVVKCNSDFKLVINHVVTGGTPLLPQNVEAHLLEYHASSTYSYNWGDGTITSTPHSHVYPSGFGSGGYASGTYEICVTETTALGCVCKSCVQFTLPVTTLLSNPCDDEGPIPSSLKKPDEKRSELIFDNKLEISPNPSVDQIEIKFELIGDEEVHVSILDASGKSVKEFQSGHLSKGVRKLAISTEQLPVGVYYVKLRTNSGESVEKLHILK